MSAEKDGSPKGDHDTQDSGSQNVSVDVYETNPEPTAHKQNGKESLSATLTILAAGFGMISDGCNFHKFHARAQAS